MDQSLIVALLDETLQTSGQALFDNLELDAEFWEPNGTFEHDIACAVGFTSPTLRGNLTLTADRRSLSDTRPAELRQGEPTLNELCDWIGELGNQILGRFKNRLIASGNVVELGTPAVICGFQIKRGGGRLALTVAKHVRVSTGSMSIYIDAQASEDFTIQETNEEEQAMPEGGLALF